VKTHLHRAVERFRKEYRRMEGGSR
jgi:hypothetical protein